MLGGWGQLLSSLVVHIRLGAEMDKEVAKSLISLAVTMDQHIVSMFSEVEKISNDELRQKFKQAVGDLMGYIARDVIFPIVDIYPDLDPDK
jgi:hypothetical protein